MDAALAGSDEVVTMLLDHGVNPDKTDSKGNTPLVFAIQGGVLPTIETLARVTSRDLGWALYWIAREGLEVTGGVLQLVEKAGEDSEAIMEGVEAACEFGAVEMLKTLLAVASPDYPEATQHKLLESAIKSDCALTCAAVLGLVTSPVPKAIIASARQRGNTRVLQLLTGEGEAELEARCREVRNNRDTADVCNQIPKTREFPYNDPMTKLKKFLADNFANGFFKYFTSPKNLFLFV